jgi:hypothetical protein
MKIRNGFVSNSSSSSFMIQGGDIAETSMSMLRTIIADFKGFDPKKERDTKRYKIWMANLKTALKNKDVKDGKIGITMPSCNYETYLILCQGYLYITTCNNHHWDIDDRNYEDSDNHEKIYGLVRNCYFYNVRNKMIHSYEKYEDSNQSKCPNCTHYYGNYIIDKKGNRLCASCFKGKLGPTDEMKMEEFKKIGVKNPITSLELSE